MLLDDLRRRLAGPLPGREAWISMAPRPRLEPAPGETLLPAAALVLIYPHANEWWLPLTVRGAGLRHHGGQVSLPGGRLDHPEESIEQAALREAWEEIGVPPSDVEILGRLTPLPIAVSGHLLCPVVGVALHRPYFSLALDEVERLIEVPLTSLLQPDGVGFEQRPRSRAADELMTVPYFAIEGAQVWGATAMILAEFVAILPR